MPDPNSHHPDMFRHDETVGLRLELARVKDQRDAFQAALRKEVLAIIREEIANTLAQTNSLKADVEHLKSENLLVREEADRYCRLWQEAKAEVERLTSGINPEGHNDLAGRAVEHCLKLQAEVSRLEGEREVFRSYLKWNAFEADFKDWDAWRRGENGSEIPFPFPKEGGQS